ncbi:hypothetical protein F4778DRAFT_711975 [Xylariomycetidae sp. FL2044]|nr:hypothetical protein F4778DRAFT_711975 [Xylariomycetidae sp. FL2044]
MVSALDCTQGNLTCVTASEISVAGLPTPTLPNEGYRVFFAIVIMIILSGLTVIARIWTRIHNGQMGTDDYVIVAALGSCITQMVLWALAVRYGYGADYLRLDEYHRRMFNKWWFLGAILYPVTICLYKSSVILLNKRIFVQKHFQTASWIILIINICWGVGNTLGWIFQCIPIQLMWGDATEGVCWDMDGEWISLVAWNVFTDIAILTMPLPMVWKLNLKTRDKIMLSSVFLLGATVTACSFLSCSSAVDSLQKDDGQNTLTFGMANLFQVLESNIGIITSCLPILRAPLRQMFPRVFGTPRTNRAHYYYEDRHENTFALNYSTGQSKASVRGSRRTMDTKSDPDAFNKLAPRKSDELSIIHERAHMGHTSHNSSTHGDEESLQWDYDGDGIRKTVKVSVHKG